nr:stalk domain-containing protein [uncultured Aminipila sp.]
MKKFIAGLIVGLMFTSTVSFASQGISATFGNFNFLVNGQAKSINTQPIVYNGTSYLPVREISSMLGYNVDYQSDTRTIKLTNSPQDNSNTNTVKGDSKEFVILNELFKISDISASCDGKVLTLIKSSSPKKITFDIPSTKDGIYTINTDYGTLDLKMVNGAVYLKADEVINLFTKL